MFHHWSLKKSTLALCLVSIVIVTTARAGTLPADTWRSAVRQNAITLQRAEYDHSLKSADRILSQMLEHLGSGSAEDEILAAVIAQKALANAGLGRVDQALWYWFVAQAISPAAGRTDLTPFGAPGEFLKRHPASAPDASAGVTATAPRILKRVVPEFRSTATSHLGEGVLIVRIIVDRNGQPTQPRVLHLLPSATLSFAALEALRNWQFAPGTRSGEKVPAPFELTLRYKL